ncbi:DNA cytosine methyltransferase, partial [Streptomyces yokosukanensis]|uniref:DNA cytosine methyltransferase n=1 Tax=Streptomyces yokosukanensis TaxID=67386 RepID=UPI00341F9284
MHVARAVEALRPCLVVIENVRGLLTSPAGSPGDVEFCPWCLGDDPTQRPMRALGAVLGSLADLRYDARWLVLRASDVGAPHRRERTFLTYLDSSRLFRGLFPRACVT